MLVAGTHLYLHPSPLRPRGAIPPTVADLAGYISDRLKGVRICSRDRF
jgi:hypothetical protein